ncbi:MAG: Uma2 family endonuclease [Gloeocapsa sp. DLM2.Bin57]|nr:MAG: Uma2 family endonuclease [Gloeocapsa sp. DLM2.Bin57]
MQDLSKWSIQDYHLMIDSGIFNNRRVELLEGEIREMSPESPLHRFINDQIAEYLRELLRGQAKVFEAQTITLNYSEPEPDLSIVRLPNSNYLTRHPYPEDIYWLIEIANTTLEQDLGRKKKIYANAGIKEYWLINLITKIVIVFREPSEDDYKNQYRVTEGTISPIAFPNLEIKVTRMISS